VNRAVKAVAAVAAVALALSVVAIVVALHRPVSGYPLMCSNEKFTSPQTGSVPIYYPCSTTPPRATP
jgi:hypothetical protein